MKKLTLFAGVATMFAIAMAATMAVSASAAAVITTTTTTTPFSDTGLTDDCLPGATGSIAGTAIVTLQEVETGTTAHFTGTEVDSARIDWSNGDYSIIGSTDRFAFTAAAQGTTENTDAHSDFGNVYNAQGVFLFRETFQAAEHFTVTNGDVTRVNFVIGHFHIFGSGCWA